MLSNTIVLPWAQKRLFWPLLIFLIVGWLTLLSSSYPLKTSFFYAKKQALFMGLGFLVYGIGYRLAPVLSKIPTKFVWGSCVLCLLVPLSPLGLTINGARRWIALGPFSLQLSEFVKVGWIFIISRYAFDYHLSVQKHFFASLALWMQLAVLVLLLLLQPDFGSAFVLAALTFFVLFVARVRLDFYALVSLLGLGALIAAISLAPYRMARFLAFLDPWSYSQHQAYQLIQSLIGIGSGGFLGKGLGNGLQKFHALPESHTDFIFAIWLEETGFIGGILLLGLWSAFLLTLMKKATILAEKKHYFASYALIASACLFFLQVSINLGVCLGVLPTKGLTLPFFSYGGSSLWACMFLIGVLDGLCEKRS